MKSVEHKEKNLETIEKNPETINWENIKEEKAPSGENKKKLAFAVMGNNDLKTTIAFGLAAAIIGGVIGYRVKPVAKTQDLVVTEDVSAVIAENNGTVAAETPGKTYTQITDILDNARHVVEERFYASDGSIVACEDGYAIIRKDYDNHGNLVSTAYFDIANQPFFVEKLGYSSMSMTYDEAIIRPVRLTMMPRVV